MERAFVGYMVDERFMKKPELQNAVQYGFVSQSEIG
jgi:hypothetical protein